MCKRSLRKLLVLSVATFICGTFNFHAKTSLAEQTSQLGSVVFPLVAPKLTSAYGKRKHPVFRTTRHHQGVDLQAPSNSHVRAIAKGRVVFADSYAGFGKLVTIEHSDGYTSLYGHLSEILVDPTEEVNPGDLIGRVGSSGIATGPHLHFEWRKNGKPLDPLKVFPSLAKKAEG